MGDVLPSQLQRVILNLPWFVSVVGGGIQLETGTLDDSEVTTDVIIIEDGTTASEETFNIVLDRTDVNGSDANSDIILDGTDGDGSNGFSLLTDTVVETNDTYGTANDRLFLEEIFEYQRS